MLTLTGANNAKDGTDNTSYSIELTMGNFDYRKRVESKAQLFKVDYHNYTVKQRS